MAALTDLEIHAIALSAELADTLGQIVGHGSTRGQDIAELVAPIHVVQKAIMGQAAARLYPERFRLLGETLEQPSANDPQGTSAH